MRTGGSTDLDCSDWPVFAGEIDTRYGSFGYAGAYDAHGVDNNGQLLVRGVSGGTISRIAVGNALSERIYFTQDRLGSVTAAIATDGTVLERYVYTPYGERTVLNPNFTADTDNISDIANNFALAGYYYDTETGLYQIRHRFYHADMAVWLSRDPIGYVDGGSLYEYVGGSPTTSTDSTGLARTWNVSMEDGNGGATRFRLVIREDGKAVFSYVIQTFYGEDSNRDSSKIVVRKEDCKYGKLGVHKMVRYRDGKITYTPELNPSPYLVDWLEGYTGKRAVAHLTVFKAAQAAQVARDAIQTVANETFSKVPAVVGEAWSKTPFVGPIGDALKGDYQSATIGVITAGSGALFLKLLSLSDEAADISKIASKCDDAPSRGAWSQVSSDYRAVIRDVEAHTRRAIPSAQRRQLSNQIRQVNHRQPVSDDVYRRLQAEYREYRTAMIEAWERNTGQSWPQGAQAHHVIHRGTVARMNGGTFIRLIKMFISQESTVLAAQRKRCFRLRCLEIRN